MKFTYAEYAMLVRYIVQNEKKVNPVAWKVPAIKALRDIRLIGLREAKMLVEAVDNDPLMGIITSLFGCETD